MTSQASFSNAARDAGRSGIDWLARAGLASRGILYAVVGVLAIRVATGDSGGEAASQTGALEAVSEQPFGTFLLWVLGVGLLGLALWQATEAAWGHRHEGDKRIRKRAESALKVGIYTVLGIIALRFAMGQEHSEGGEELTARLLGAPGGQLLVGAIGAGIAVAGVVIFWRGLNKEFDEDLDYGRVPASTAHAIERLGQAGYIARGVVFGVIGVLVASAAVTYDPSKARGMDLALKTLAGQPYGMWILGAVAVGLLAFGVFCLAAARYARV